MPGLSQLKQFNSDILALGNEPVLRAQRGEKAVSLPIPKGIKDIDDSDDFVIGMPEIDEEAIKQKENVPVDEDFSDIMGSPEPAKQSSVKETETAAISLDIPDLNSLSMISGSSPSSEVSGSDDFEPDLSMFMEPVETEPEVVEEQIPEEKEIADLSLDDLLSGEGFDGSEGTGEDLESVDEDIEEISSVEDLENASLLDSLENASSLNNNDYSDDALSMLEEAVRQDSMQDNSFSQDNADSGFGSTDIDMNVLSDANDIVSSNQNGSFKNADTSFEGLNDFEDLDSLSAGSDLQPDLQSDVESELESGIDKDELEIPKEEQSNENNDFKSIDSIDIQNDFPEGTDNFETAEPTSEEDNPFDFSSLADPVDFESDSLASDFKSDGDSDFDLLDQDGKSDDFSLPEYDEGEDVVGKSFSIEDFPEAFQNSSLSSDDSGLEDAGSLEIADDLKSADEFSLSEEKKSEENEEDISKIAQSSDSAGTDNFGLDALGDLDSLSDDFAFDGSAINMGTESESGLVETPEESLDASALESFSADDFNFTDLNEGDEKNKNFSSDESANTEEISDENEEKDPFSSINMDLSDMDFSSIDTETSFDNSDNFTDGKNLSENEQNIFAGEETNFADEQNISEQAKTSDFAGFDSDDNSAFSGQTSASDSSHDDFPIDFDFNIDDLSSDEETASETSFSTDENPEIFDISEMDGMEFPETDAQISSDKGDFELGQDDDFKFDNGDFEIPGFSDVQTVAEGKNGKIKLPEPDFSQALSGDNLPANTLSDEQFQNFLKNLETYPLNVRLAVEELVVKNEFTDEAEFEIIQKVLKKVPARQLASELEKMLDIAIPVPRDFEKRTAEEYEAYKNSFQYQLKNRIIPGSIVGVAALVICAFIFLFVKTFVYIPMVANKLYEQGYALLEENEYSLSREKFDEAVSYQPQKKWYDRYAKAYREHKQFIRAEEMYELTLGEFNFPKDTGLEYARMELEDLANYEKSEKILNRYVLDHYPDDQDAILALGDTYLEWGTERDSSKMKNAYERYSYAIHRFGENNRNLAGMMKYFVRTDNLREVLKLKPIFMENKNSLSSYEWSEMGGYLLDKLHGPLLPSDEFLRGRIDDMKTVLTNAVDTNPSNPLAQYNMGRYYINRSSPIEAKKALDNALKAFSNANVQKRRDLYKYIDSYRLSGEISASKKEYVEARERYTDGIVLFQNSKENSGLEATKDVGKLYSDLADIDYYISGDMDAALNNYQNAIESGNDTGAIRYKIGYIQYERNNFDNAIHSFMKASEENAEDSSLLMAMGNTLSMKGDNWTALGYYEKLLQKFSGKRGKAGYLQPQFRSDDAQIVDTHMKASNNLGVVNYRIAKKTGSSRHNADAMINLQNSMRDWDAMTRNQTSMVRLGGGNLAEQNFKYVSHPHSEYEPAIYTDIPKSLNIEKGLTQ